MPRVILRVLPFLALIASCSPSGSDASHGPGEPDWMEETRLKYEAIRRDELHVGMTRDEVRAVLGAPTEEDAKGLHYDVEGYWLDVLLDDQGKLRETLLDPY